MNKVDDLHTLLDLSRRPYQSAKARFKRTIHHSDAWDIADAAEQMAYRYNALAAHYREVPQAKALGTRYSNLAKGKLDEAIQHYELSTKLFQEREVWQDDSN